MLLAPAAPEKIRWESFQTSSKPKIANNDVGCGGPINLSPEPRTPMARSACRVPSGSRRTTPKPPRRNLSFFTFLRRTPRFVQILVAGRQFKRLAVPRACPTFVCSPEEFRGMMSLKRTSACLRPCSLPCPVLSARRASCHSPKF